MILRERQKVFVERSHKALNEHGNTLGVAPTGSGKTVMLSAVIGRILEERGSRALVLAHRDEITTQNIQKFRRVNPGIGVSVVDSNTKSWAGKTTFAMVQTLARENNLAQMPRQDLLVVDEAHHARADTYLRIIKAAKAQNPALKIYGVTATPSRGDGRSLREIFTNCCDQITLAEMIQAGHLVKPRTLVVDVGTQEDLSHVRRIGSEFDMNEVAAIMNRAPLNAAVVEHWQKHAGDRQTVVFCSTIDHAEQVLAAFQSAGVAAEMVTGETPEYERAAMLRRLDDGTTRVLINVAVLTEGWDSPPVSCVVLLRPCSHKSTMTQMIGRGLRKLDPDQYPGKVKTDCIVLDFGTSVLTHGSLEQEVDFAEEKEKTGLPPLKACPECGAEVPIRVRECPFCEHVFPAMRQAAILEDFEMAEIDLFKRSPFQWCPIRGDGSIVMATGFDAWGGVFQQNGQWAAIGGTKGAPARLLHIGDRVAALASADDWLNLNETETAAHKTRRWLNQPPTEDQLKYLPTGVNTHLLTRYEASCQLTYRFNKYKIEQTLAKTKVTEVPA
jgi:superfamily II DNA or RNA helicase